MRRKERGLEKQSPLAVGPRQNRRYPSGSSRGVAETTVRAGKRNVLSCVTWRDGGVSDTNLVQSGGQHQEPGGTLMAPAGPYWGSVRALMHVVTFTLALVEGDVLAPENADFERIRDRFSCRLHPLPVASFPRDWIVHYNGVRSDSEDGVTRQRRYRHQMNIWMVLQVLFQLKRHYYHQISTPESFINAVKN